MDDPEASINPSTPFRLGLPTVLTSFIGREHELAEIAKLIQPARLVTLTGVAGCGKTRLALHVASALVGRFPDGIFWVGLARMSDPEVVPSAIARELGAPQHSGSGTVDALVHALHDKHLLLILDNCEHLLSICSPLAETLLSRTSISILATSREPLNIAGEFRYPVSPMALPSPGSSIEAIGRSDAVRIFIERAQTVLPSFALTADNANEILEICRRLDGIPLPIELASVRVNVLTLGEIARRLEDRFALLDRASPMILTHHETLRSAINWSYDLLTPLEQSLLRRLSVFAGDCSLTLVDEVCSAGELQPEVILDLLESLVNKSLVIAHTLHRSEARYSLLETIREFAHGELAASGEWNPTHDRYLESYLRLAEDVAPKLSGQFQHLWLDWLETEFDNIRVALSWSLESRQIEAGLRLAIALYEFWTVRDYAEEGLEWYGRLTEHAGDAIPTDVHADALGKAGLMAGFRGNALAQAEYARKATRLAESAGEDGKRALLWALVAMSQGARGAGDNETEFEIARQVIQIERELGDWYLLGVSLSTYSTVAMNLGDFATAHAMLDEGLALLRESGDPYRLGQALNYHGDLARCERRFKEARAAYEESASRFRESDAVRDLASALHNLAYTCIHLGDVERARDLLEESLTLQQSQGNMPGVAECLAGFGALAIECGLPAAGARLLAVAIRTGGERISTAWPATRMEFQHFTAKARMLLGEAASAGEQDTGRRLSVDDAVAYARQVSLDLARIVTQGTTIDSLTPRERDVAALIAQGKSNIEIADQLSISKRTVEKHIANIRSKLQFSNRSQIVRWAIESRLTSALL